MKQIANNNKLAEISKSWIPIDNDWVEEWITRRSIYPFATKATFKRLEKEGWFKLIKDGWKDRPQNEREMKRAQKDPKYVIYSFSEVIFKEKETYRRFKIPCAICGKIKIIKIIFRRGEIEYPEGFLFCENCFNKIKLNEYEKYYKGTEADNYLLGENGKIKIDFLPYHQSRHPGHGTIRRQYIEALREVMGLTPLVSVGELRLREIVKEIFPKEEVYFNDRSVLFPFELDIFLPKLKLAFEYQGKQHFAPVTLGGISKEKAEEKFKEQQKIDELKRNLCKHKGIILIEVRYDEPLSKKYIFKKIKKGIEKQIEKSSNREFVKHI
jgi:hypothetical protein